MSTPLFRFDNHRHEYIHVATGDVRPHITGILEAAGLIDDRWYSEESCERGSCVHRLTADYDLGAIEDTQDVNSKYQPYLLGHVECMQLVPHRWDHIEEPLMDPQARFGGRPDRVGIAYGAWAIDEIKSGLVDDVHEVQTALQALLVEHIIGVPAESIVRYAEYLKPNGKYRFVEHKKTRRDMQKARELVRRYC